MRAIKYVGGPATFEDEDDEDLVPGVFYEFEGGFGHYNTSPANLLGDRPCMVFLMQYGRRVGTVCVNRVEWPPFDVHAFGKYEYEVRWT